MTDTCLKTSSFDLYSRFDSFVCMKKEPTVHTLLDGPEVEAFKKYNWGGGPIPLFYGAVSLTNQNVDMWEG